MLPNPPRNLTPSALVLSPPPQFHHPGDATENNGGTAVQRFYKSENANDLPEPA